MHELKNQLSLYVILVVLTFGNMALTNERSSYDRLVVFGDSLSDTGNAGRFSNGPVWTEILAAKLKLPLTPSTKHGSNFAVGGARIEIGPQSLRAQVDRFLSLPRSQAKTLYIVWGGGNDVLAVLRTSQGEEQLNASAESLRQILADLFATGASEIVVPNVPNVGMTPDVRAYGAAAIQQAAKLTAHFNEAVDEKLGALRTAYQNTKLYRFNVAAMAERAKHNPAEFGFTDIGSPCQGTRDCSGYLFWDGIHPTTDAHNRLAAAALALVLEQ